MNPRAPLPGTITAADWPRALKSARLRRVGAAQRMADEINAKGVVRVAVKKGRS